MCERLKKKGEKRKRNKKKEKKKGGVDTGNRGVGESILVDVVNNYSVRHITASDVGKIVAHVLLVAGY